MSHGELGQAPERATAEESAARWVYALGAALAELSPTALGALFEPAAGWRDLVAFTWNLRQAHDRVAIVELLVAVTPEIAPRNFRIDEARPRPSVISEGDGPTRIEAFFRFSTAAGDADAYVVLTENPDSRDDFRALTLLTRLTSLTAAPPVWPPVGRFDALNPGVRWSTHRQGRHAFDDRDPEVLIVGGGQFGLMTAAHLARLDVDALIIDKQPRVGDAWRSRYESLFLHQPHNILHFAMMPFPESFPEYLPKDKMAQWFETYVQSFDLNFWTSTELLEASYDPDAGLWKASIRTGDGTVRVMRPKHVLMATGGSNIPTIPDIEGLDRFEGTTLHAAEFNDGADFAGKNVLIIGCGTSAHDFALDIVQSGGAATLVQRSPLIVINLATANTLYGDYLRREVPTELVDMRFLSGAIYHQQRQGFIDFQAFADDADRELHEGLKAAGLQIWAGEEGTGFYYGYLSKSKGGYYINVGASDAIVRGDIGILQLSDLNHFDTDGVVLADGSHQHYDAVVFATAYQPLTEVIKRIFGSAVADKLGPVWGFGTDGEMRNVLKPTAQEGLWILDGSIPMARWHSPLMAMLVKADLLGIIPESFKVAAHASRTPQAPVSALAPAFRGRIELSA